MYNWKTASESSVAYWEARSTDGPNTVNGFAGTWAIKDHALIPQSLMDFLSESFYGYTRLSRVPLEDINDLLNQVWDGPGSMAKITRIVAEKRQNRREALNDTNDPLKGYDTPTVDSNLVENIEILDKD